MPDQLIGSQGLRDAVSQVFISKTARGAGAYSVMRRSDAPWDNNEESTFMALYAHPLMRLVVSLWWVGYRYLRLRGVIPSAMERRDPDDPEPEAAWEPRAGKRVGV